METTYSSYRIVGDPFFFFRGKENHLIPPSAQGGAEDSARLVLTKTPPILSVAPCQGYGISNGYLNGFYGRPWQ